MMTRMFGFCGCCARAGAPALNAAAVTASTPAQMFFAKPIIRSLWNFWILRNRAAGPFGPAATFLVLLLARVPLTLLELFHDLIQVVARRILKWGELLVGFQLLQPQHLPDGQQVPVVYVSADRPGERAAEPETRLFLIAPRHLEWIAFEVYHAGCELGLDSRGEEARRGFGRDREIHLPVLVAHRRRVAAGIVEEGV